MMVKNVCSTPDRAFRIVVGLVILALWFVLPGSWHYLAVIGLIPLLTVALSYCPISHVLGINTCRMRTTGA